MADPDFLMTIIGILVSILIVIIGWIGSRIYEQLGEINITLTNIDKELRQELSRIDTRLTVVETKIGRA
jgi:predicted PurR-regulated permease PerM